jgi:hypothetical protein
MALKRLLPLPITVWTVDVEMPVCNLYLLFIFADIAKEQEKKCCCPLVFQSL